MPTYSNNLWLQVVLLGLAVVSIAIVLVGLIPIPSGSTGLVPGRQPGGTESVAQPSIEVEGLDIEELEEGKVNLVGRADHHNYGIMSLVIPTNQGIQSLEMYVDGKKEDTVDYEVVTQGQEFSRIALWNKPAPVSMWLSDGDHDLFFRVATVNRVFEAKTTVSIDTVLPSTEVADNILAISDSHKLEGATMYLYRYDGLEDPVRLKAYKGGATNLDIPLNETSSLIEDKKHFRVIGYSDEYGNLAHIIPDDSRPFEEIIQEYGKKYAGANNTGFIETQLAGTSIGMFSPLYIFNADSDTTNIPGDVWTKTGKEANIQSMVAQSVDVLKDAGKDHPYSAPNIVGTLPYAQFLNENNMDEWGLKLEVISMQVGGNKVVSKKIIVWDTTDATAVYTFYFKELSVKKADPTKIPIIVVDAIKVPPGDPEILGGYLSTAGTMLINYSSFINFNPSQVWEFNYVKGKVVFAHEVGHALNLGHAADQTNLQYPAYLASTLKWDAVQDASVAAHTKTMGLLPANFGEWAVPGNGPKDYTCSNRRLERGKPNSTDEAFMEEAEDDYAGSYPQGLATTVEINDWKGGTDYFLHDPGTNTNWKACPIIEKYPYNPSTGAFTGTR
ncbi:MAG: hypothetical protein HY393_04115, partial [Candidatus Diapherotrites archaeon]|nr:hypothetical protein [Candidatus Diapherotrites archaeon]